MDLLRYPWANDPAPVAPPAPDPVERPAKRRGRRPAAVTHPTLPVATTPDWLYHHLTISGPVDKVAAFAAAARGSGVIPWRLDFAALEEDIFVRAIAQPAGQRNLTIEGCRILARQFRERMEARQARAAALLGRSHACPFDLHTLLPVPAVILQLGPTHPEARTLAGGALGHHRSAAAGGRAAKPGHRPAAGETSYRDRLWVLHRR